MSKTISLAFFVIISTYFLVSPSYSQTVIFINGSPTQVVLEGEEIKSLLQDKISNYLASYGQKPDDAFTNAVIDMSPEASRAVVSLKSTKMMAAISSNNTASHEAIKIKLD